MEQWGFPPRNPLKKGGGIWCSKYEQGIYYIAA